MSADDAWGRPTRTPKGQFAKGTSGNRRGRPRKMERAYAPSQIRQDILGLMEKEIDVKVMGKNVRLPVILAIYWRMLLMAADGNERMMLAVVNLRRDLLADHKAANMAVVDGMEEFEKLLADGGSLDNHTFELFNDLRRRTRTSVR